MRNRFILTDILDASPETLENQANRTANGNMRAARKDVALLFEDITDERARAILVAAHMQSSSLDFLTSMMVYLGASFASTLGDLKCVWFNNNKKK